jgi:NAD(P)-dependent dehydrogenase (short-subunit alcohol dehydrogenase family)
MAKSHHDKIAVISGGANGIGQAFAQRLAQDGAHIVIADVAPGGDTVKMVEQAARHALACKCDVSSEDSVRALAGQVNKRFGRCDILINCAGIFPISRSTKSRSRTGDGYKQSIWTAYFS